MRNNDKNLNNFFNWLKKSSDEKIGNEKLRTIAYTNDLYWRSRLQANAHTSPLELNIVYSKHYIKSGGLWSKDLLLKLSKVLVRKIFRIVKKIISIPKHLFKSISSGFKKLVMT